MNAWIRMPLQAAFDHAAGDELAVDASVVAAWVDDRLRRQRAGEGRPAFPCVTWIRRGLSWSHARTQRALEHAVHLGYLHTWEQPVQFLGGARMSRRYKVNVGVWNDHAKAMGWVKLDRASARRSTLHVAVLLVHAYEFRQNHCVESTTSEIAAMLGCSTRAVRRRQAALREARHLGDAITPTPGLRYSRLARAWWLSAPMQAIDYLGAPMLMFEREDMRTADSKRLLALRSQLQRHMDGENTIRLAALALGKRLGEAPTVRQVIRWCVRRYRSLIDPESLENAARGRVRAAALGRTPEFAARRAEVMRRAAMQLASAAPPG